MGHLVVPSTILGMGVLVNRSNRVLMKHSNQTLSLASSGGRITQTHHLYNSNNHSNTNTTTSSNNNSISSININNINNINNISNSNNINNIYILFFRMRQRYHLFAQT